MLTAMMTALENLGFPCKLESSDMAQFLASIEGIGNFNGFISTISQEELKLMPEKPNIEGNAIGIEFHYNLFGLRHKHEWLRQVTESLNTSSTLIKDGENWMKFVPISDKQLAVMSLILEEEEPNSHLKYEEIVAAMIRNILVYWPLPRLALAEKEESE